MPRRRTTRAAVTTVALDVVPGVSHTSITQSQNEIYETLAPTDPVATAADQLQYELNSGPVSTAFAPSVRY